MPQGGKTQQPTPEADETAVVNEVTGLFHQVVAAGQIEDPVSVQEFLSPIDEAAGEPQVCTIEEIIEEHLNPEQNDDEEIQQPPPPPPTAQEADTALKLVREYLVRQDETERQDILYIEQIVRRVEGCQINSSKQTTLERWFT